MLQARVFHSIIIFSLIFLASAGSADRPLIAIAHDLTFYTHIVANIMLIICVLLGLALIITGIIQIRMHFKSPKFIPLPTPIVYIILGIILILVPFAEKIFGYATTSYNPKSMIGLPSSKSNNIKSKYSSKNSKCINIDIDKPM